MGLSALDILVLLAVGGAAALGFVRGFVSEVLSLFAWVAIVFVLNFFLAPVKAALMHVVGTSSGAAVLAFALLVGGTYFAGRYVSSSLGRRTKQSILGPVDRALGFGFGAVKGLILASLAFLLFTLVTDTAFGGPAHRPEWMTKARTYPLLNSTSASISSAIDRRRHGAPMFGPDNASIDNGSATR